MRKLIVALAVPFALVSVTGFAQSPPPGMPAGTMPMEGTVKSITGDSIVITAADGKTVTMAMHPETRVMRVDKKALTDIHQGDFVGSAAMAGTDGKLHAEEVHIIAQRGLGEGHRPMGADPNRSMTNATVTKIVSDPAGETLTMQYAGGEQALYVAKDTLIVAMETSDASAIKPGAQVKINMATDDKGTMFARAVRLGKDGMKPAM